ncbi:MAG: RsmF rRNA methyltransferase first C-terminal domain-containing protein [Clostridia bacterium]|nr:RsmF rRNA methyltransferase first C-terminal domain-containing protein [Clostridia bacterium]
MSGQTHFDFPQEWVEQLKPILGPMLPDFLHSYEQPPARGLRVRNGIKPPEDAEGKVPWAEKGYYLSLDSAAGAHPLHEAGAYYLQEPSAMAAAAALHPVPGEKVLDLCAAPGGKSTQLAAFLQGDGLLVCNEPVFSRAQILSRNIERMGVPNAVVVSQLPEELSGRWPGFFDRILVDAPCSGEGMFRRHPETVKEWTPTSPAGCARRQRHILNHAALMLRPGGVLAYSTCTFNPTENEGVIEAFLCEHPGFSLLPFALNGLPECGGILRLWPHRIRGEGHFVALLKKDGEEAIPAKAKKERSTPALSSVDKNAADAAGAFLKSRYAVSFFPEAVFAGKTVQPPNALPPLDGVKTLRVGLHLGEMKGRIFVPDHALALYMPSVYSTSLTVGEARLYQAGQTLPAPESLRGFCTPTLNGLALGWAKAADGILKNHYPKGLRRYSAAE